MNGTILGSQECCRMLMMTSKGIATIMHRDKLGYYQYYAREHGDTVYQLTGVNVFLHKNPRGSWTV